jgi:hypothetical protein
MTFQGIKQTKAIFATTTFVLALAGCSAGGKNDPTDSGGSNGSGGSTPTTGTITESLSASTVTSAAPVTVSATVRTSTGVAVAGTVVTFTTGAIGALSSATALTNSSGVATVSLSPASGTSAGADTVIATATIGTTTVTASQGYQLNATTAQVSSITPDTGESAADALSAYGQAVLTVALSGVSSTAPAALSLTSQCVTAGKATISPATVNVTSNTATFTYKDSGGCGSTLAADTVTASIGSGTSQNVQVFLTSPTPNSITFSSATPPTIYLKGSGYTESANVKFQVVDTDGNPLPGQQVTMALSTLAGGLLINQGTAPVTQTSDSNGFVSAIINSGTVPTPVRVTATLKSGVTTVSSTLSVATGLPTQLHFSLAEGTSNIEGWDIDGTPNTYTVRATDRSGNPVPDGTSVLFWSEGGQVQATATTSTTSGVSSATANFVSQAFRPADGRVTVLAYAIGEESFIDLYGTNVYQAADATHPTADPFQDLGDIIKSRLYDNIYDAANDETISLSLTGAAAGTAACVSDTATYPQFVLDKSTPVKPGTCDAVWSGRTYVRKAIETVFSTSAANPIWPSKSVLPSTCQIDRQLYIAPQTIDTAGPHAFYSVGANPIWYTGNQNASGAISLIAADRNIIRLNPMPAGTIVNVTADDGTIATFAVTGGSPIPNSTEAGSVNISYKLQGSATSATGVITFTSPSKLVTSVPFGVTLGAPPTSCP